MHWWTLVIGILVGYFLLPMIFGRKTAAVGS
jgi:hypothetical protein